MLENIQLTELRKIAKERGLKNISKLKKDELIELLNKTEEETNKVEKESEVGENEEKNENKESFVSRKSEFTKLLGKMIISQKGSWKYYLMGMVS